LGGGGACLVYHPRRDAPEAVLFMPGERRAGTGTADRPAAVPLMARGLFALTTRMQGARPFEELIAPAEQQARFGAPVSRALAADLAVVRGALLNDPNARAVFARADGTALQVGDRMTNSALGGTLTALRSQGVGDMHQGALARRLVELVPQAGGGDITLDELRAALPAVRPALLRDARGGDRVGFLPVDGGVAAAAGFAALGSGQDAQQAQARALAVGAAARAGQGGNAEALLAQADLPPGSFPALPASTGLTVFDRQGGAVTCVFTMNNLFGTGRMAPGTGMLLAAAPGLGAVQPPLVSAAIGWNPNLRAFRMAIAGSGQQAAPMAVAGPLAAQMLRGVAPGNAAGENSPEPGRSQLAACPRYLPGRPQECQTVSDPRGLGVALGAVD
jgi:gamma-glutamyltranspeptidase/glutathione hydrolase